MNASHVTAATADHRPIEPAVAACLLHNIRSPLSHAVSPMDIRARVQRQRDLPPMPGMLPRILAIAADANADVDDLARVAALDPMLAAQIMRWAASPLYGYRGKLHSLHDAIARVLGFDAALGLALGLAALSPLRAPKHGPLGTQALWRHAVHSAQLVQGLINALPRQYRPERPGLAYLAGLLHDIGFLLLAHLFPGEYSFLSRLVQANVELPVLELERYALGVEHTWLGLWLLQAWELPEEVQVAVAQHHNVHYAGEHAAYARLVLLSDRLLCEGGVRETSAGVLPQSVLDELGLSELEALAQLAQLRQTGAHLDALAAGLN